MARQQKIPSLSNCESDIVCVDQVFVNIARLSVLKIAAVSANMHEKCRHTWLLTERLSRVGRWAIDAKTEKVER
jgi:hypothetical protein